MPNTTNSIIIDLEGTLPVKDLKLGLKMSFKYFHLDLSDAGKCLSSTLAISHFTGFHVVTVKVTFNPLI